MKYAARLVTLFLCLLLCLSIFITGASALDTPSATRTQRVNELTELIARYEQKDAAVGNRIKPILQAYRATVEGVELDASGWALDAYYYQGVSAGILSWIYYAHPEIHPNAQEDPDTHSIYSLYTVLLAEISSYDGDASKSDAELCDFFLGTSTSEPLVHHAYTRLLNAIYAQKLMRLAGDGDSNEAKALIETAALRLSDPDRLTPEDRNDPLNPTPSYRGEDAEGYRAYYAYVIKEVEEQRLRDAVQAEVRAVYRILFPSADAPSLAVLAEKHEYIRLLLDELPCAETVAQMNRLLCQSITAMLNDAAARSGVYTSRYLLGALSTKIQTVTSAATVDGQIAQATSTCFGESYRLGLARAEAKDKLCAVKDGIAVPPKEQADRLDALLAEYTADGGAIDLCTTVDSVASQLALGQGRLAWFGDYIDALLRLNGRFAPDLTGGQAEALASRLHEEHERTDRAILEKTENAREQGQAVLAQILCDAEIDAFLCRYPIASAPPSEPTQADLRALTEALLAADALSKQAKSDTRLLPLLQELTEAYKHAVSFALSEAVGLKHDTLQSIRSEALTVLREALAACSDTDGQGAWDFDALYAQSERLLAHAAAIGELGELYENRLLSLSPLYYAEHADGVLCDAVGHILSSLQEEPSSTVSAATEALLRLSVLNELRAAANAHASVKGVDAWIADAETALLPSSAAPPSELEAYKKDRLLALDALLLADEQERQAVYERVRNALEQYGSSPEEYSAENALRIEEIVSANLRALEEANEPEEYRSILEHARQQIEAIPTLLLEAKEDGLARLRDAYNTLMEKERCYSAASLEQMSTVYEAARHSVGEGSSYLLAKDIPALRQAIDEAILALRAIRMDRVYTEADSPVTGSVSALGAIPYDASLIVRASDGARAALERQIRSAAKNGLAHTAQGESLGTSLLNLLKGCVITSVLVLEGEAFSEDEGTLYEISLSLPDTLDLSEVLGLVRLAADGSIEFYELDASDGRVVFSGKSLSSYYLVSARVVDLSLLLVALGVLICAELAVLFFLYRRRARKPGKTQTFAFLLGTSVRYRPSFAPAAALLLGLVAAGLGVWIAVLLLRERSKLKKRQAVAAIEQARALPALAMTNAKPLPLPAAMPLDPLPEVTPELAEELMSDAAAREQTQTERDDGTPQKRRRRATVNLDTISLCFGEGDTVSLCTLKEKGLIPPSADFVKILARGRLDKPLTVLAQDFSMAAIKMILLTGGTAIRVTSEQPQKPSQK